MPSSVGGMEPSTRRAGADSHRWESGGMGPPWGASGWWVRGSGCPEAAGWTEGAGAPSQPHRRRGYDSPRVPMGVRCGVERRRVHGSPRVLAWVRARFGAGVGGGACGVERERVSGSSGACSWGSGAAPRRCAADSHRWESGVGGSARSRIVGVLLVSSPCVLVDPVLSLVPHPPSPRSVTSHVPHPFPMGSSPMGT